MTAARPAWRGATLILAAAYVVYALYFDWSDAQLHTAIALLVLLVAVQWPKLSALTLAGLLVLVSAAAHRSTPLAWGALPEPGQNWLAVRAQLGSPRCAETSLAKAQRCASGYASPSPLRYPSGSAVAVYVRGDAVLWVFHDNSQVIDRFTGGS